MTGRTYGTVPGLISGVIALGLSFKPGGATCFFRGVLREVLEASVEVVSSPSPTVGHESVRLRDIRLNLFLPSGDEGRSRLRELQECLHGDVDSNTVKWCCPGGATPEAIRS